MSSKPSKKTHNRMGNPRTVPLRPEDLTDQEALEKFIFPRLLDIVNQTDMTDTELDKLIQQFKQYWESENLRILEGAKESIQKKLKGLSPKDRELILKTLMEESEE